MQNLWKIQLMDMQIELTRYTLAVRGIKKNIVECSCFVLQCFQIVLVSRSHKLQDVSNQ